MKMKRNAICIVLLILTIISCITFLIVNPFAKSEPVSGNESSTAHARFKTGEQVNVIMKNLSTGTNDSTVDTEETRIRGIERCTDSTRVPGNAVNVSVTDVPIKMWFEDYDIMWYSTDEKPELNPDSSKMFYNLKEIEEMDLSNFDTSNVTDMTSMFQNSGIRLFSFDGIDISNVTSMKNMFYGCTELELVNVHLKYFKEVTDMSGMFSGSGLLEFTFLGVGVPKVTNMSNMFAGCRQLEGIYFCEVNLKSVTDVSNMFVGCSSLKSVDMSKLNLSNVTDMKNMFTSCTSLEDANFSEMDISKSTSLYCFVAGCDKLKNVSFAGTNMSSVENVSSMFGGCTALETADLSNVNASSLTSLSGLFAGDSSLKSVNLGNLNISNATNLSSMFGGCSSLESANFSGLNLSKVTNMGGLFSGCGALKNVNFSGTDMRSMTNISGIFSGADAIESVDFSNVNASSLTSLNGLFANKSSLTNVNLENLNVCNVTNLNSMFTGCSLLKNIDFSKVNLGEIDDISYMFANCGSLANVNLSGLNLSKVTTNIYNIFERTYALESVDFSNVNASGLTSLSGLFANKSSLTSINFEGLDIRNVTNLTYMFSGCSSLKTVNLSNVNASSVTTIVAMFKEDTSLESVDFRNIDLSSVTTFSDLFYGCSNLKTIYATRDLDLTNVEGYTAFGGCVSLVGGLGTNYREGQTGREYARVDGNGGRGYFTELDAIKPDAAIAEFNNTTIIRTYSSLGELFSGQITGNRIILLSNIADTTEGGNYTIANDKNIILDLNGHTITTNRTIVNNGTLAIKGKAGVIRTTAGTAIVNNGVLSIGDFYGNVNTSAPEVCGAQSGVVNSENATFNFYGGAIKGAIGNSISGKVSSCKENFEVIKATGDNVETSTLGRKEELKVTKVGSKEELKKWILLGGLTSESTEGNFPGIGIARDFSIFAKENVTLTGADIEGKVAAGGGVTATTPYKYQIGMNNKDAGSADIIVGNGPVENVAVNFGYTDDGEQQVEDSKVVAYSSTATNMDLDEYSDEEKTHFVQADLIDFDEEFEKLEAYSRQLAELEVTPGAKQGEMVGRYGSYRYTVKTMLRKISIKGPCS